MQALIEWSDELSVGIQEIDEQHKLLLKMMNDLHEAIKGGWAREARDEILKNLVDYTKTHFTVEESLMRILGYPDYERHKQEHTKLINQLNDFLDEYHRNAAASSYDLLFFLRKWLTEHIKKSDKAYEKHFINMGVKRSWLKASWFERFFWS